MLHFVVAATRAARNGALERVEIDILETVFELLQIASDPGCQVDAAGGTGMTRPAMKKRESPNRLETTTNLSLIVIAAIVAAAIRACI